MNMEPAQLFYIDNYTNALVIFSAFKTKEVIFKGPYQFWDTFRKIRYRIMSNEIRRIRKTGERNTDLKSRQHREGR